MGAWVSVAGSIDCRFVAVLRTVTQRYFYLFLLCRLAALPGGLKNLDSNDPRSIMLMTPGMADGKYLSLRILVQNRTQKAKPMGITYPNIHSRY
jgi:hypothetical protein